MLLLGVLIHVDEVADVWPVVIALAVPVADQNQGPLVTVLHEGSIPVHPPDFGSAGRSDARLQAAEWARSRCNRIISSPSYDLRPVGVLRDVCLASTLRPPVQARVVHCRVPGACVDEGLLIALHVTMSPGGALLLQKAFDTPIRNKPHPRHGDVRH